MFQQLHSLGGAAVGAQALNADLLPHERGDKLKILVTRAQADTDDFFHTFELWNWFNFGASHRLAD